MVVFRQDQRPCPFSSPRSSSPRPSRPIAEGCSASAEKLTPEWLLDAYSHGIFPWPTGDAGLPIPWCSPDPRAIFDLDRFHVPRRLAQTCRSGRFRVSLDEDFPGVIRGCATSGNRVGHTWLIPPMIRAYTRLHELGHAHSVEVWDDGELAGGTYGIAIEGCSRPNRCFNRVRDASKVALVHLVDHLRQRGYALMDIQQLTPHTAQFGAFEIPRIEYLRRVAKALAQPVTFGPPAAALAIRHRVS